MIFVHRRGQKCSVFICCISCISLFHFYLVVSVVSRLFSTIQFHQTDGIMSTQHYTEDLGVEVHMSPSYWDKWTPTPTPPRDGNADAAIAAIVPSNNADSDDNVPPNRTIPILSTKKSLLALSIVALSVGGAFIALGGTTNDNTAKSVDVNKLHKTTPTQVVSQDDGCGDIRRVLIVPGSEDFQQSSNEEPERQRRILNLKGGASARQRRVSK